MASETWIDRHQTDQICQLQHMFQPRHRCVRIQSHARLHAQIPYALQRAVQMRASLNVHGQYVGPQRGECLQVAVRIDNHQMHVQRFLCMPRNGFDDRHPETDVRHKDPVHDVEVKPVCVRGIHQFDVALQIREICSQQGRSNQWIHGAKLGFSCDIRGMGSHKIVGLTGGMASGKSTVRRMFEGLGVPAWDADLAGHEVYRKHRTLRQACAERWGAKVLHGEDDVNRAAIASIAFGNPGELAWLNGQVHPLVRMDFEDWVAAVDPLAPYVIRESAILFEAGIHSDCAAVVCVVAPEAERVARAVARTGMSEADARLRMSKQWSDEQRKAHCQFIIDNGPDVTLSDLSTIVERVHGMIIESLT